MRILALKDLQSDRNTIEAAFVKLFKDYSDSGIENVEYKLEEEDFNFTWVKYNPNIFTDSLGVDFSHIKKITEKIERDKYDMVCILIDSSNWQMGTDPVWGWNLGRFFNGTQVQLIRVSSIQSTYLVLAQELMHTFDQFIKLETGTNINKILDVKDFDEDVVHKLAFSYNESYRKLSPMLNKTFYVRKLRYRLQQANKANIMIIQLLAKIIAELKMKLLSRESKPFIRKDY